MKLIKYDDVSEVELVIYHTVSVSSLRALIAVCLHVLGNVMSERPQFQTSPNDLFSCKPPIFSS